MMMIHRIRRAFHDDDDYEVYYWQPMLYQSCQDPIVCVMHTYPSMNSSMQQTAFMLKTARKLYVNLVGSLVLVVRRIKNEMKKS